MKTAVAVPLAAVVLSTQVNAQTLPSIAASTTLVAVIVKVPKPWYAPRAVVVGKMRDTIPQYQNLPGLNYKMFSFARMDGHFGGIYLWRDRASAEAWFNPGWHERVKKTYGAFAAIEWFGTPVLLPSKLADNCIDTARPAGRSS